MDVVRNPKPIGAVPTMHQQSLLNSLPLKDSGLPETECYTVTLHKDDLGLGITVAGYVCEKGIAIDRGLRVNNINLNFLEEISGIFVKSISKGSAADLTGKIKINDRIVEVKDFYLLLKNEEIKIFLQNKGNFQLKFSIRISD